MKSTQTSTLNSHPSLLPKLLHTLLLGALFALPAGAGILTVGDSPHCDFAFLDDAIRASAEGDEIQIEEGSYTESDDGVFTSGGFAIIDQGLKLVGGFDTCGGQRVGTSTLTTGGIQRILTITASKVKRWVFLEHLVIEGGGIQSPYTQPYAGGILAQGSVELVLIDVRVEENEGIYGGGITLLESGEDAPRLTLADSRVADNDALEDGGGVYCRGGLIAIYRSTIDSNTAEARGGGFFLDDCDTFAAEMPVVISGNLAKTHGGGFFLTGETPLVLHPAFQPVGTFQIRDNKAQKNGGGVYLEDSSLLRAIHTSFTRNIAWERGGAIAARSGSEVRIGEDLVDCGKYNGCQGFSKNWAGLSGGALDIVKATAVLVAVRGYQNSTLAGHGAFLAGGKDAWLQVWSAALDAHFGDTLITAKDSTLLDVRSSSLFENVLDDSVIDVKGTDFALISQSIFHDNGVDFVTGGAPDLFTCNVVDPGFPWPAGEAQTLAADPLFVAAGDYHLGVFSPALNYCRDDTLFAPVDLELDARPGPTFDAGADER